MPTIHTAHILSHTHWDREWYLNSPYTNPWLVPFFDSLFRMLEKEPGYRFVLDGQTSMIEDWVEQLCQRGEDCSAKLHRLSGFVRQGRVCVGPYYLQPDWQLVSEEALVRNLLIGQRMAEQLGGRMDVGWLLDNFGQISQTAQIHRQFGLDGLFVWRGVEMDPREIHSEFIWESPDGSRVTAVYLVGSYRNGMRLAEYADSMRGRIAGEIQKLAPFATTPNILLMNGYDQEMFPDDILPMLQGGLSQVEGVRVVQSTPQEYLKAILSADERRDLPILRGALYSGRYISVFPGILSSRMYLKLQNDACQRQLEKRAEPLSTALWLLGGRYPAQELDTAWRLLLKNHPHDSICGVSIDDVHTDMEDRFQQCAQITERVVDSALSGLCAQINTGRQPQALKRWVVFNTGLRSAHGLVKLPIHGMGEPGFVDASGSPLAYQRTASGDCLVRLTEVPALGYQTIYALPNPAHPTKPAGNFWLHVDPIQRIIENVLIKLVVNPDGSVELTDKVSQTVYPDLMVFEDSGDAGDTYNTSNPKLDSVFTSRGGQAEIRFLDTGPLRATVQIDLQLSIPTEIASDRQRRGDEQTVLPIRSILEIDADSAVVKCRTAVSNTARDHRLRVLFPSNLQTDYSHTETQFDVVPRAIRPPRYDDSTIPDAVRQVIIGAREPEPVTIYPQRTFVDLSDGVRGLAVLNRGLPEVEILPEHNTIALTLFRGVGWIARPDLLTRIGDAGPLIAVPGAQCLRRMVFDYAVFPHLGDWQTGQVIQQADGFNSDLLVVEVNAHTGQLGERGCFLRLDDPSGQLKVTAVKRAEHGQGVVVRLHNPTMEAVDVRIWSAVAIRQAWRVNLAEVPDEPLPVLDGQLVGITIGAKKIVTVLLETSPASLEGEREEFTRVLVEEKETIWDDFGGAEPPVSIRGEDIANEEARCAALDVILAQKERDLQAFTAQKNPADHADLLKLYQLQLDAASYRRTALEARLSLTLLRKNAWLDQHRSSPAEGPMLAQYETELRKIGDAINTARVEKRALEYVVDYYSKQAKPKSLKD